MAGQTMMMLQVSFSFLWMVVFLNREVFGTFVCPTKFTRVGCFKDSMIEPRPLPQLLMTDRDSSSHMFSGKPIHWGNWDAYFPDLICRCAEKAKAKGYNVFGIQHYGECWSGCASEDTYFRDGNSSRCITYDFKACGPHDKDCVGKNATNFVYTLNGLHSAVAGKLNAMSCQHFLVAIRKSPTCGAATPLTHAHSVVEKVQNIYSGYSCLKCLKVVNESSSAVFLMLQFTCQGLHLKKLVAGLGAARIIKAECSTPPCVNHVGSIYTCASYPCGVSSCSISPSLPYPTICPVPVHYPVQSMPSQCPMSCPSVCAPACNSLCCRSFIGTKNTSEQSSSQSNIREADNFDDGEVIEDNAFDETD